VNDASKPEKPEQSDRDTGVVAHDPRPDTVSGVDVSSDSSLSPAGLARRRFLRRSGAVTTGVATLQCVPPVVARPASTPPSRRTGNALPSVLAADAEVPVDLTVNGHTYTLQIEPRVTLLDALRERVGLTGTKKGCDRGQCGACTVLVNGRRINSCLTLAVMHDGDQITTIEGIAPADGLGLHRVQRAFVEHDGFQCGFCTPGQICSAVAMLDEVAAGTASAATLDVKTAAPVSLSDAEIRERMSGNLCRCGAYVGIVDAIRDASSRMT
jgi:xanthine dehydrogenase YagT iron-sulfur-binding subunit